METPGPFLLSRERTRSASVAGGKRKFRRGPMPVRFSAKEEQLASNLTKPSELRLVAAFSLAAIVPTVCFAAAAATWGMFGYGLSFGVHPPPKITIWFLGFAFYGLAALFFAAPLTGVVGVFCYFVLRRFVTPRRRWAVLTGSLIPSVPSAVFILAILIGGNVDDAPETVLPGMALGCLILAALGGIGGWTFWTVLSSRNEHQSREATSA